MLGHLTSGGLLYLATAVTTISILVATVRIRPPTSVLLRSSERCFQRAPIGAVFSPIAVGQPGALPWPLANVVNSSDRRSRFSPPRAPYLDNHLTCKTTGIVIKISAAANSHPATQQPCRQRTRRRNPMEATTSTCGRLVSAGLKTTSKLALLGKIVFLLVHASSWSVAKATRLVLFRLNKAFPT